MIAYSTCSQLGYMFFACGVGAYDAGIFHLYTHAFFKALLFLGAGSVIHAMSGEQDMRKMGGIWSKVKITYAVMWIGTLALVGFPGFAGFFCKDADPRGRLGLAQRFHYYAFWMGELAAILTAFYSGRLIWLTFHGEPRADEHTMHHVHESPPVMLVPLIVLAIGRGVRGLARPGHDRRRRAPSGPGRSITASTTTCCTTCTRCRCWVKLAPLFAMVVRPGPLLATSTSSGPGLGAADRGAWPGRSTRFFYNKWYFDELYDFLFVRPAKAIGWVLWRGGDVGDHRPVRAGRRRRIDAGHGQAGDAAADRLRLPLRLRHADRRRGAGQLVPLS